MSDSTALGSSGLDIDLLARLARGGASVSLTAEARARVAAARAVVERAAAGEQPIYGLNTGLGGNLRHRLAPEEITAFQTQFVVGRAIGVGEPLPRATVRAAMVARANAMTLGGAGVSPAVLDLLLALVNRDVTPVVPRWGSIGAGDLGLLAHIALVIIGRGSALHEGRVLPGAEALLAAGLGPATLGPKDGLALCNGNALSAAMAGLALHDARRVLRQAERAAVLSFEGYAANPAIFDARLAAAHPAVGQVAAAERFRALLAGSSLYEPGAARSIQDALSFRCLSQVHGAADTALERAVAACELELNAAADNPLVLAADDEILSTGNFHLMALSLAGDALAMALSAVAGDGGRPDRQADAGRSHAPAALLEPDRRRIGRARVDAENGGRALRRNSSSRQPGVPRPVRRQRDRRGPQCAGAARLCQARGPGCGSGASRGTGDAGRRPGGGSCASR
jgi:histidine ammonia-lyase